MRKRPRQRLSETDLYPPLRDYLASNGYTVHSEVKGCDVAAIKDGALIVIEQKLRLNIELLAQAAERQRITESVYVAVPRSEMNRWQSRWPRIKRLLRRLEVGLILVSPHSRPPLIDILFHPLPSQRRKTSRLSRSILQEIKSRTIDVNRGGSSRTPIMTAYKENALQIAVFLETFGPLSAKQLRAMGCGSKTLSILYDNYFDWFERVGYGVYDLKAEGRKAIARYSKVADAYRARVTSGAAE